MGEMDGSFWRVGVVGEWMGDLDEREEDVKRRDSGGERRGVPYWEEEGSWYAMEGRVVMSWWRLFCSDKEASEDVLVVRPE